MHKEMCDLFELTRCRKIQNVIAPIMQIVAPLPTLHNAVLPAGVPDRATDFFGLNVKGS